MSINPFYPAGFSPVLLPLLACFGFVFPSAFAQNKPKQDTSAVASGSADHARAFAFEVVSIHPHNPDNSFRKVEVHPGGDEFQSIGMPLAWVIEFAYFPAGLQSKERIVNAAGCKSRFSTVAHPRIEDVEEVFIRSQGGARGVAKC
jgi:hypothetical protein